MATLNLLVSVDKVMTLLYRQKKNMGRRGVGGRKTYQSITVVNGNWGPGDVCNVTNEGAVCLEKLSVQYPLCSGVGFSLVTFTGIVTSSFCDIPFNLIVPLHYGARRHQPAVRPQTEVELLSKGRDIEELFLIGRPRGEGLPLDALLVGGREQVGKVVSVRVGAEWSDEAVFLQPVPQLVCKTEQWNMNGIFKKTATHTQGLKMPKNDLNNLFWSLVSNIMLICWFRPCGGPCFPLPMCAGRIQLNCISHRQAFSAAEKRRELSICSW